jgi:hypothetical protein
MPNNRVFWATHSVGIAPFSDTTGFVTVHGAQSIGINTTFNLEQAFELGQIALYQIIENVPDIEVTMEKVIDGYPILYHLCARGVSDRSLNGSANQRCHVAMNVYPDTFSSASGTPVTEVFLSGMYVSSLAYNISVDGNCTESVTLVGNNKTWRSSSFFHTGTLFNGSDVPLAETSGFGGIQRRQNVVFLPTVTGVDANGQINDTACTILPRVIAGISSSGTNDLVTATEATRKCALQSIRVSADLGREAIYELGHKGPYYRFINFPIQVATEITAISKSGDQISATEAGILGNGNNISNETIKVKLTEGLFLNLGNKNKLQSSSIGGGDTGGGNQTITYSFVNWNELTVTHPEDPQ